MKQPEKPVDGDRKDWDHAAQKAEQSWNTPPGGGQNESHDEKLDRTRESYGIGKDGADPANDDPGEEPAKPAG